MVAGLTAPEDRIFVWGFRPEIYYYARRLGASRYLESQPLTGVLADRHLERSEVFRPEWVTGHRWLLERELGARRPAVMVDGLGPFNGQLSLPPSLLVGYHLAGATEGAKIYRRDGF